MASIQKELEGHKFWEELEESSESESEINEELEDQLRSTLAPMPTLLDEYLKNCPLINTLIHFMNDSKVQATFSIVQKLPNSCKSVLYCLVLAYNKRILIKKDHSIVYLCIENLYKFIRNS